MEQTDARSSPFAPASTKSSQYKIVPTSDSDDENDVSGKSSLVGERNTCDGLKHMFKNPIVVLLFAVPIAWVLHYAGGESIPPVYNFVANFCAIVPLSWIISESTEHLEKIVGPTLGVLLNSTFGNLVEIILSVQAIRAGLVKLVQASLLGAIFMNTLGVLGLIFFVSGIGGNSHSFNTKQALYNLCLLSVASLGVTVPTGLAVFDEWSTPMERLNLSRWVAVSLISMYVQYLIFSMCTHKNLFEDETKSSDQEDGAKDDLKAAEEEEPEIHWACVCTMLFVATVLVAFHCDWLVESIEPVARQFHVKQAFVGTVILPMVGNFSEVIASVTIAYKGKLDLAMGVALGSSLQIALCVIPIAVIIAWTYEQPLDLDFETYQVKILLLSLLISGFTLMDGTANWLKGSLFITAYVIVSSSFWFMHNREFESAGVPPELIVMNKTSLAKSK